MVRDGCFFTGDGCWWLLAKPALVVVGNSCGFRVVGEVVGLLVAGYMELMVVVVFVVCGMWLLVVGGWCMDFLWLVVVGGILGGGVVHHFFF